MLGSVGKGCSWPGIQSLRSDMSVAKPRFFFLTCIGVGMLLGAGPTSTYARTPPPGGGKSENDFPQAALAKKLVLKDGNYQLVREYQRDGDRVRYLSAE